MPHPPQERGEQSLNARFELCQVARQRGGHVIHKKPGKPNLVIPMHRTVAPFLLPSRIRRAGLTEDDFSELLRRRGADRRERRRVSPRATGDEPRRRRDSSLAALAQNDNAKYARMGFA
jgi:hypothetical protein